MMGDELTQYPNYQVIQAYLTPHLQSKRFADNPSACLSPPPCCLVLKVRLRLCTCLLLPQVPSMEWLYNKTLNGHLLVDSSLKYWTGLSLSFFKSFVMMRLFLKYWYRTVPQDKIATKLLSHLNATEVTKLKHAVPPEEKPWQTEAITPLHGHSYSVRT